MSVLIAILLIVVAFAVGLVIGGALVLYVFHDTVFVSIDLDDEEVDA